jgi:hypothetical protein
MAWYSDVVEMYRDAIKLRGREFGNEKTLKVSAIWKIIISTVDKDLKPKLGYLVLVSDETRKTCIDKEVFNNLNDAITSAIKKVSSN